jgi:DNA-binding transcriptional regulator YiaG
MGRVYPTEHFTQRCDERTFTTLDAEILIETGVLSSPLSYDHEHNSWKFEISGTIDRKGWRMVVALDCGSDYVRSPRLSLVTVHRRNATMRRERKDYKYKQCGLPNVVLTGITVYTCEQCGAEVPEILSIASLHRFIMIDILKKRTLLCGEEIRFLRKMARMTATELGKLIGADSTTLSKWENNARKIGTKADRVLRLVCYSGMLEHTLRTLRAITDESFTGAVASTAKQVETLDIREFLANIENKKGAAKRVTINPDTLRQFGTSVRDSEEALSVQ